MFTMAVSRIHANERVAIGPDISMAKPITSGNTTIHALLRHSCCMKAITSSCPVQPSMRDSSHASSAITITSVRIIVTVNSPSSVGGCSVSVVRCFFLPRRLLFSGVTMPCAPPPPMPRLTFICAR